METDGSATQEPQNYVDLQAMMLFGLYKCVGLLVLRELEVVDLVQLSKTNRFFRNTVKEFVVHECCGRYNMDLEDFGGSRGYFNINAWCLFLNWRCEAELPSVISVQSHRSLRGVIQPKVTHAFKISLLMRFRFSAWCVFERIDNLFQVCDTCETQVTRELARQVLQNSRNFLKHVGFFIDYVLVEASLPLPNLRYVSMTCFHSPAYHNAHLEFLNELYMFFQRLMSGSPRLERFVVHTSIPSSTVRFFGFVFADYVTKIEEDGDYPSRCFVIFLKK